MFKMYSHVALKKKREKNLVLTVSPAEVYKARRQGELSNADWKRVWLVLAERMSTAL